VAVSGSGVFTATGANQFGTGPATIVDVGFNTDPLFLGFQFDTGQIGFDGIAETVVGNFGVAFDARFAGKAGLEVGYYFDSGSVDARYPFNFGYQYLDTAGIKSAITADPAWNRQINLSPTFGQSGQTYLRTNFPEVGAYTDFVVQLQASAEIEGCIFGCVEFNLIPGFLRNVDERQELFAFNRPDPTTGKPDGNLRIFGLNSVPFETALEFGSKEQPKIADPTKTEQSGKAGGGAGIVVEVSNIGFNQPISLSAGVGYGPISATTELANLTLKMPQELDLEGSHSTPAGSTVPRLDASGKDGIVDLKLDVDALAGAVIPFIPPGEVTLSLGPASLHLNLFDYELGPQLSLAQTVSLAPEPTLTLAFDQNINVVKNGVVERTNAVAVRLGVDDVQIQFPNRELNVTPTFSLNPKFSNNLNLDLALTQSLEALSLSADFAGLGGFELGPVYTREDELARTTLANLVNTRFDLTGAIESAVNLNLQPFTMGEGMRLKGESAAVPRYAESVQANGASTFSFRFDATDLGAGPKTVYVSYFGSHGDTYRSIHDEVFQECTFDLFGCWNWETRSEEHTTQAIYAAHTDRMPSGLSAFVGNDGRTYSFVNPAPADNLVTLPDRTPLRVAAANSADLVPADLRDVHTTDSGDFLGLFRWSESDHVYYSDLVDVLQSRRYDGLGMTTPVYLAVPELDVIRDGDNFVTRFASTFDFDVANFVNNATGYEFESLILPGKRFFDVLSAFADTDGIWLQVWDAKVGDWVTVTTWVPTAGRDFHFNFFDDYLRAQLGQDSYLVSAQGNWAVDGVSRFRLGDLDFGLTLADLDLDALLDRFGPGGTDPLVIGVTVTDLVTQEGLTGLCWYFFCSDANGLHGPLPGTGPSSPGIFGTGSYYAGTKETIHDPTKATSPGLDLTVTPGGLVELARTAVVAPPVPQPESGLGAQHDASVPPENVPPEGKPVCVGGNCESNAIRDPDTGAIVAVGTGFQELADKGYLNPTGESRTGQHPPPPPQPSDPKPPPGSHPTLALGPNGGNGRDVFVFDFAKVDFGGEAVWGGPLAQRDLVFHAGATLTDGTTPCGLATPSFTDGQVVSRAAAGVGQAHIQFDTGGRNAAEFASCFTTADSMSTFGKDAPVYLELPFAPSYDFLVEGPLFTSLLLPYAGDNALLEGLIDVLLFDAGLDDYVLFDRLGLGDQLFFPGEGVDRFRLAGLDLPFFWLDHDPDIADTNPRLVFGFTFSEPGTVVTSRGSGFPAAVPEPATWTLLVAGGVLMGRRWRGGRAPPRR
jgi:hypothetical protein